MVLIVDIFCAKTVFTKFSLQLSSDNSTSLSLLETLVSTKHVGACFLALTFFCFFFCPVQWEWGSGGGGREGVWKGDVSWKLKDST